MILTCCILLLNVGLIVLDGQAIAGEDASTGSPDDGGLGGTVSHLSTLVISDCFYTVRGSDGTGQRFTRDVEPRVGIDAPGGEYVFTLFLGPKAGKRRIGANGSVTYTIPDLVGGEVVQKQLTSPMPTPAEYVVWG